MNNFFDSEIVKNTMNELTDMQSELIQQVLCVPSMTRGEKVEHFQLMKDFLEKQKILFFRMSLSDDPEAKEVCDKIIENAKMFGIVTETNPKDFFDYLEGIVENLEKLID